MDQKLGLQRTWRTEIELNIEFLNFSSTVGFLLLHYRYVQFCRTAKQGCHSCKFVHARFWIVVEDKVIIIRPFAKVKCEVWSVMLWPLSSEKVVWFAVWSYKTDKCTVRHTLSPRVGHCDLLFLYWKQVMSENEPSRNILFKNKVFIK